MPRRTLIRRFEPRYGVSQEMLDYEGRHVGRELEDYVLQSHNDLSGRLSQLGSKIDQAEAELQQRLASCSEIEQKALRCMLARDLYHIAMLYNTFIINRDGDRIQPPETENQVDPVDHIHIGETDAIPPLVPFKETLFG